MTATATIYEFPKSEPEPEIVPGFTRSDIAEIMTWLINGTAYCDVAKINYLDLKDKIAPDNWADVSAMLSWQNLPMVDKYVALSILEYNRRYAVIVDGAVTVVDRKTKQEHRPEEFFKADPSTVKIESQKSNGDKTVKEVKRAKLWFESTARTQYTGKCLFPMGKNRDGKDYRTDPATRLMFNKWKGWGVKPKAGYCGLFLDHLLNVACDGNAEHYEYMLNWMAHVIQRPWIKPRVAIVLWSQLKQTGKSMVGEIFRDIIGPAHSTLINKNGQVTGRFADLCDSVFCQSEEALFSGDPATVNITKDLITNSMQPVEHKFKQGVETVPSYTAFMFTSNSEKAVHVSDGEERFFVLKVSPERKGDKAYFQAVYDQMRKHGGNEALLHMLQRRDISNFVPWVFPKSHALGEMALEHEEPVKMAILEAMRAGGITIRDRCGEQLRFIPWVVDQPLRIDAEDLWQAFSREAAGYGEDRGTQTKIGMALDELGLVADKQKADARYNRKAHYLLKPLKEAFETVAAHYDVTLDHLGYGDLDAQAERMEAEALAALNTLADFLGWDTARKHRLKAEIESRAAADVLVCTADAEANSVE